MGRTEKRANRREAEKNMKKHKKTLAKLTTDELALIDLLATQKMNCQIHAALTSYERVILASMLEHEVSDEEIQSIWSLARKLIDEEDEKAKKLNKELQRSGDVEMVKKKIEESITNEINKLMDEGKKRKEVIESVLYKFPHMSKAMIINAYQEVKEDRENNIDPDMKDAMEYIFEENEENEIDKEKDNKIEKRLEENAKKIIEVAKEMQCQTKDEIKEKVKMENKSTSGLKIKSMVLQGENGVYRVCENGVELTEMGSIISFENEAQVDEWVNEVKEVFGMIGRSK